MRFLWLLAFSIHTFAFGEGTLRFASIFTDHLVLQRDQPIRVWGFGATEGEEFVVQLGDDTKSVASTESDYWETRFDRRPESSKGITLRLLKQESVIEEVNDILIGDVWLAAGQSNMQMQVRTMVKQLPETAHWVSRASYSNIRVRRINDPVLTHRDQLADDWQSKQPWSKMTTEVVLSFSAVASSFAREIEDSIHVPIGIIDVSWGGKPIESFIPRNQFQSSNRLQNILKLSELGKLEKLAQAEGGLIIRNPEGYPGAIYNARMAPIHRFPIRGFLWYQGESNAGKGEDPRYYREKMGALVRGWRENWNEGLLPFYFVQLPSFAKTPGWIRLREEQRLASLAIPNCEMAVTIDLPGEDIHPPHKIEVGRRLAQLALHHSYQEPCLPGGPLIDRIEIKRDRVVIHWSQVGDGLAIGNWEKQTPLSKQNDNTLAWFELADQQGIWHQAETTLGINPRELVVKSSKVPNPSAVRYGCATVLTDHLLYNSENFPASPFCSKLEWLPWKRQN